MLPASLAALATTKWNLPIKHFSHITFRREFIPKTIGNQWRIQDLSDRGAQDKTSWPSGGVGGAVSPPAGFGAAPGKILKFKCFQTEKSPISTPSGGDKNVLQAIVRLQNVPCYSNRTNFRTRFNFVYFVLLAESTKFSSIRKPYTYACVSDTKVAVWKFLAYESWQTLEYEIFTRTKISAITVYMYITLILKIWSCETQKWIEI